MKILETVVVCIIAVVSAVFTTRFIVADLQGVLNTSWQAGESVLVSQKYTTDWFVSSTRSSHGEQTHILGINNGGETLYYKPISAQEAIEISDGNFMSCMGLGACKELPFFIEK